MASVSRAIATSKTPLRLLTSNFNKNVLEIVKVMWAFIMADSLMSQYIWIGRGWDHPEKSKEHGTGRALDIIITERVGMMRTAKEYVAGKKLVDTLIKYGRVLRIQWVLFSLDGITTWSYNMDRGYWKKLDRRGDNVSANHVDHIHVYFKENAVLPSGFSFGGKNEPVAIPRVTTPKPWPELVVDGIGGPLTVKRLQSQLKVRLTGKLDHFTVRALKVWLGSPDDGRGIMSKTDVLKLQYRVGVKRDGIWGPKTWEGLQRFLNAHR